MNARRKPGCPEMNAKDVVSLAVLQKHQETVHGGGGSQGGQEGIVPEGTSAEDKIKKEEEIKMTELLLCSGVLGMKPHSVLVVWCQLTQCFGVLI